LIVKKPNSLVCKFCRPTKIIIKNKHISIKKIFSHKRLLSSLLLFVVLFSITSRAKAYESPLQSLIGVSQEKLDKSKKATVDNPIASLLDKPEEKGSSNDKSETKLQVPNSVTDTKEMEKAVEFASEATGVRKDFIMGMLVVESNLGRNPGKCTYQEVEDGAQSAYNNGRLSGNAWQTFKQRREIIKDVSKSLGYDYEKVSVSCNPVSYAGTGGAIGIPQFMPDTWLEYKDRVSAIVGKENPDPWNEKDAAVAMALKLSDVYGVTSHSRIAERNAAKMYLSGTTSSLYDWYANQILYWADNYNSIMG
jgi:membrane-bound lytic murein transglycosylase B